MSLARTLQIRSDMAHLGAPRKILLVCPWIVTIAGLTTTMRAAAVIADIVRVDFEAALRASLSRHRFDLAVYTPTQGLTFDVVMSFIRQHAPALHVIEVDHVERGGDAIVRYLRDHCS